MDRVAEILLRQRVEFSDKALREHYNNYNNLWKWIYKLQFVLISRNRLLLDGFFTKQEMMVQVNYAEMRVPTKIESVFIDKIKHVCNESVQRVDIFLSITEA